MSDEEKKAINNLNFIIVTDIYDNEVNIDKTKIINEYNKSVGIVLNLIKKQSKEIEEVKQKEKQAYIDGTNIAHRLCNKKWNDKIKARIEELEEYLYKGNIKDDFLMIRIKAKIQELQSLLEKE